MAQLAILGHETRGKEVIEILKMLGGENIYNKSCSNDSLFCYISDENRICELPISESYRDFILFALEEFLEKFPYKVGDKVIVEDCISPYTINDMIWEDDTVKYRVNCEDDWLTTDELQPYSEHKEETIEESIDKINKVIFDTNAQCCDIMNHLIKEETMKENLEQIILNIPNGYDFIGINDDNQIVLTKKHIQYPKNYEECCKVLCCKPIVGFAGLDDDEENLYGNFIALKRCRDAYWKIAGEEMGLGKPWEPDWNNISDKYCIYIVGREIWLKECQTRQCNLAFPTAKIRDAFYENFENLIEECKELL